MIAAALGVFGTGSLWPDFAVAVVLAALGITSGGAVIAQARAELAAGRRARQGRYASQTPRG